MENAAHSAPGSSSASASGSAAKTPASFETAPDRYRHWTLQIEGEIARLNMAVREDEPLVPGYQLKLNSYDLGVDIELADAVQRLRFGHPEVRVVIVGSGRDRVFCAGANIHMLAQSTHGFKVNFCKYTNETRLYIEDAAQHSGQRYLAQSAPDGWLVREGLKPGDRVAASGAGTLFGLEHGAPAEEE